jgi:hypothetical protein
MFWYIARISLVSKCGTGAVILAGGMTGPPDLGGCREAVKFAMRATPPLPSDEAADGRAGFLLILLCLPAVRLAAELDD